jgi:hypothetical protein
MPLSLFEVEYTDNMLFVVSYLIKLGRDNEFIVVESKITLILQLGV